MDNSCEIIDMLAFSNVLHVAYCKNLIIIYALIHLYNIVQYAPPNFEGKNHEKTVVKLYYIHPLCATRNKVVYSPTVVYS